MSNQQTLEAKENWEGTYRNRNNNRLVVLLSGVCNDLYLEHVDYDGLFPWGAISEVNWTFFRSDYVPVKTKQPSNILGL